MLENLNSLGLQQLAQAILSFLAPTTLLHVGWATLLGIVVGMLPGLTATMGVALMATLTYKMAAGDALLILICMYVGAIYGGSRSAILLNIPGTPASAATTLDGTPLARAGKAGRAMTIATIGSVVGTIVGIVVLTFFSPILANSALKFGPYEFFWLAVFGMVISGWLTAVDAPIKGWIAGLVGLLAAMVGQENIHAYERFCFGHTELFAGFGLIPALVGAFGLSEILIVMQHPKTKTTIPHMGSTLPKFKEVATYWRTMGRSGTVGTIVGIIPGVGEDIAAWVSYALARRKSRERQKFGKGSVEGLMAAETGNSAAVPGALVPVLTLGIPGSAPAAVLLAAMIIHGVRPGPLIMIEFPNFLYEVVAMVMLATVAILAFGLLLTKPLLRVLTVPRERLMPIIFVLCVTGSYAISQLTFDVWVMVGFGILGYLMRRLNFPMAPLVLGIILGDILDANLRRALVLGDGSILSFFTRPISLTLAIMTMIMVVVSLPYFRRRRQPINDA